MKKRDEKDRVRKGLPDQAGVCVFQRLSMGTCVKLRSNGEAFRKLVYGKETLFFISSPQLLQLSLFNVSPLH